MNSGITNTSGQVVFQFVFDLAWEISVTRLVKSNVYANAGWKVLEELDTSSRSRKNLAARSTIEINASTSFQVDPNRYTVRKNFTAALDDSGALALEFTIDFKELCLDQLVKDSENFHENIEILAYARKIAQGIQDTIRGFLVRPRVDLNNTGDFEDYIIYKFLNGLNPEETEVNKIKLASLIDGKRESLPSTANEATNDYADEVLQYRLNHPRAGLTIANWSGAICLGGSWDGVIDIIRLANMELLELRLISEHLTEQNDEFDRFLSSWLHASSSPSYWIGSRLLARVLKTKREVKDQLGRIKNPLIRFGSPNLAKIYSQIKEIFLIDYYMDEIKEELEELKDSESTISERASARRQDILALLGVLVAFEYVTSGISNICQFFWKLI
jgi:hypothetical protein